jgi:hypothetical protein
MTAPESRQRQTEATPVSSPTTPSDKPRSDEAKRLMEQERDAIGNAREGYDDKPVDTPLTGKETFDETARHGTEPTHVPSTGSDRRG